jgi:hypothetical protein
VYAGAAREAVFARPEVIRRVCADFVPLALRAPAVNQPGAVHDANERWLYERVNRAKLAPQGIAVLNSAGQVLAWVQMFDDDESVLDFLDHGGKRFQEKADPKRLVVTERYLKYPSADAGARRDETPLPARVAAGHAKGEHCSAAAGEGLAAPGTLVARLVGRALDDQGKRVADTVRQEHYVEDPFGISPEVQQALARALAGAGRDRVRLPDEFGKTCATHAHLGHIDVRPCLCMIKDRAENKGEWKQCAFWAQRRPPAGGAEDVTRWRIDGLSEVVSAVAINGKGVHNVRLAWDGFLELRGERVVRLILAARGREKLQFANDDNALAHIKTDEVAFLPAGRPVDVDCGVRYGILGEAALADRGADPAPEIPEEARKQLVQALGGPFLVFRDRVQEELKLSDQQKQRLLETFPEHVQETMKVFEKLKEAKPEERAKEMQEHRRKAHEKLAAVLKDTLKDDQRRRLRQLELQQEGPFVLGGEVGKELNITDEQRQQFMAVVQDLQKKIAPLVKEAESGGNPQEIIPRMRKVRREHEDRIVALLTNAQKKQWQEMLGKPLDLDE